MRGSPGREVQSHGGAIVNPIAEAIAFALGMLSAFTMAGLYVCRVRGEYGRLLQANIWEREQRNNAIKAMDAANLRSEELVHYSRQLQERVGQLAKSNDELTQALAGKPHPAPILAVMEGRRA